MAYQILLVDDVLLNRKVVRVALSALPDVAFLEAADGVAALEFIHNQPIDLIILDIVMPGGEIGFDILREVKASEHYKHIPVIIYSAVSDGASIKQALELGAYDYLVKPLKPQDLQVILPKKVREALAAAKKQKRSSAGLEAAYTPVAKMPERPMIGKVTAEEAAAIRELTTRKTGLKRQLKRLIDMDKEALYCMLYDKIIQEISEVSAECEHWWDEKYDKYRWANIVGDEIEIDYESGQVFVRNRPEAVQAEQTDTEKGTGEE